MYPKGINHGGLGMKNAGGKLMGSPKGMTNTEHADIMALAAISPDVAFAKKAYNVLEKNKKHEKAEHM
jgi:hypothetical protein